MEILIEKNVSAEAPSERRRSIEDARNIINSIQPIKHVIWLVDKVFNKWGSGSAYVGLPAISEEDIKEFGRKYSYAKSVVVPESTDHGEGSYDIVIKFEFEHSKNNPDVQGTFTFRDKDIDRPFMCGDEYSHELELRVRSGEEIYHIKVEHSDSRGVRGPNGTFIKITKEPRELNT